MNPISKTVAVALVTALWGGLVVAGVKVAAARGRLRRLVNPLGRRPAGGASMLGFSSSCAGLAQPHAETFQPFDETLK